MATRSTLENIKERQLHGEQVVFTNGCFDILHIGHLRYLTEAKNLGDFLVVGLNSDNSVRTLKGPNRPIISSNERKEMLLGLKPVDYVIEFDQETPLELIQQIKPNILVKGGDWRIENIVGYDFVTSYGGKVFSLLYHPGKSTSKIIEQILKL